MMHSMMVINPDVEVYLLDTKGNIVTHLAPRKDDVVRAAVNLEPTISFIDEGGQRGVKGDDPRYICEKNILGSTSNESRTLDGLLLHHIS